MCHFFPSSFAPFILHSSLSRIERAGLAREPMPIHTADRMVLPLLLLGVGSAVGGSNKYHLLSTCCMPSHTQVFT